MNNIQLENAGSGHTELSALSFNSPRIFHPDLLPHQKAAVWGIITAERRYATYHTNTCIYADNLGSGKTRTICALIETLEFPPTQMPNHIQDMIIEAISCKYLPQNLIVVGTDVYDQWKTELSSHFPRLRCVHINTQKDLAAYLSRWRNCGEDVILLRMSKSTELCAKLAKAVTYPYARVIVDDYDHIYTSIIPLGISYIGISSTAIIKPKLFSTSVLRRTTNLNSPLIVKCSPQFILRSTTLPKYFYFIVTVESPNRLAFCFRGVGSLKELVEVLASDSHEKVESLLGATIKTPADLYRILLGKLYTNHEAVEAMADRMAKLTSEVIRLAKAGAMITDMTEQDAQKIRKHVFRGSPYTPAPLKGFSDLSKELNSEINGLRQTTGAELANVREAIAANICELCRGTIGGELNAIIVKCCNKIACMECAAATWARWKKTICPFNATHHMKPEDMVHISGKVSLEAIATASVTSTEQLLPPPPANPDTTTTNKPPTTKIDVLLAIVKGTQEGVAVDIQLPNLLPGTEYTFEDTPRKVLVFTREDESIEKIRVAMQAAGVQTFVLKGTAFSVRKVLRQCREHRGELVVLINNTTHIHGYNAQFSTDLVFYHKLNDPAVMSQTAGRIQRLGRTASARIWQIQYGGE